MAPAAEMTNLSQMPMMPQPNQVIVLVDPSTFSVTHAAPVSYVTWCPQPAPCQPSFQHLQLPVVPAAAPTSPCGAPCGPAPLSATPRTDVPSDDSEERKQAPRCTASTARRLRRKRAAERAKIANASGAPKVGYLVLPVVPFSTRSINIELQKGPKWGFEGKFAHKCAHTHTDRRMHYRNKLCELVMFVFRGVQSGNDWV